MEKEIAITLLCISIPILAWVYVSDYRARKKREASIGTQGEVRMRFASWILNPRVGNNMEEAMISYEKRYAATFKRIHGESVRKHRLRNRIEYLEESFNDFDPETRIGIEELLEHYRMSLLMPDVAKTYE